MAYVKTNEPRKTTFFDRIRNAWRAFQGKPKKRCSECDWGYCEHTDFCAAMKPRWPKDNPYLQQVYKTEE